MFPASFPASFPTPPPTPRTRRRVRTALVSAVVGALAAVGVSLLPATATAAPVASPVSSSQVATASTMTPQEMLNRAATWLTAYNGGPVPYSQTATWGGYRTDCSGYVSMALGLWKPGPNTVGLATDRSLTTPIRVSDLRAGDLLIDAEGTNTTRHVVIFEKWANSSRTAYWAYEQRGTYGTTHRTLGYGLTAGSEYKPYRPVKLGGGGGTPAPTPDYPVLKQGSTGTNVTAAQYLLRAHGHTDVAADGVYGPKTASAARSFQSANGLAVDGVIGPDTFSELVVTLREGARGEAVRALQTLLAKKYGYPNVTVDGVFGPLTKDAVLDFQRDRSGLTVDGIVGPRTWAALI
ncbi:hypothetical protein F0L17_07070 [Streptomyces sp. TRM43335]|uniref:Peptidoglycan binding-like domain-containing protein n=1 Tax=Streptomyces taklimakanensis TaxID=2569853 RepID=A0A6G2B9G3_9ACTN|nr:peptidoglycan-binding protein [Streptomyces taklimakanensis]MTE18897.1 hypothetical protein [Streptomyces taklimakanensis]